MEISERECYFNKLDSHYRSLEINGHISEEVMEFHLDEFEGMTCAQLKYEWQKVKEG